MSAEQIPERLRMARARLGINMRAVRVATGISISSISRWERGLLCPRADELDALAGLYRVHPCWLLGCNMHNEDGR